MKALLLFLIASSILAAPADDGKFNLSAMDARKVNTDENDRFATEVGDSAGPFRHVGGIVVEAPRLQCVIIRGKEGVEHLFPSIDKPGKKVHVEFFSDERGLSRAVLHSQAGEPDPPVLRDERPWEHIQMSTAAIYAATNSNTALLHSLLKAGLVLDLPLEVEMGWTALHGAAFHNQPAAVRMLLRHGANRMVRSKHGDRPIDLAHEQGAKEVCQLLALPESKEKIIAGYPESLWDALLTDDSEPDDEIRFLSLNDKDPPPELLKYCQATRRNTRARSAAAEATLEQREQEKGATCYRDTTTKEYGSILEIDLKPEKEDTLEWSIRNATGPQLAGGGQRGRVTKRYGYWIREDIQSWDE